MPQRFNRRDFLKYSGLASATFAFPLTARAVSPNGKLRTAHVGVGGMGLSDLNSIKSHPLVEVVGLCDVDSNRLNSAAKSLPDAKKFRDYREMISVLGDKVDAVVVSTPDHTHAPAAMTAMNAGKHVYCQKPLTHDAYESRQLKKVAEAKGLVTQMGIQIHSYPVYRQAHAIVQSGAIGKVKKVYAWATRTWGYDGPAITNYQPVPEYLDWNLWLGPVSDRPYIPEIYHPANWRKFLDFGTGTLGDMGVHVFDTPYDALELTAPTAVTTTCRAPTGFGHPEHNKVVFEFPGTKYTTDTLTWLWSDGPQGLPSNAELGVPSDVKLPSTGSFFVGEEGSLLLPHIAESQLFGAGDKFKDYKKPVVETQSHYHQFVDACLGKTKTSASFSYGGPLTEALLIGVIGNRFPEQKLEWDAKNFKITNNKEADALLRKNYRKGFEVENL